MDASQRSTSWPGVSTWHYHGSQSACNAQTALPNNPFSQPPCVPKAEPESKNIEEYRSFQVSCYALSPTMKAVGGSAAPNTTPQCEATPSSSKRLLPVLAVLLTMVENAKMGLGIASMNAMGVKDQTRDRIGAWWLSSRVFRLYLQRLVTAFVVILIGLTLIQHWRTKSPHVYTLVHMCRSWSVYQGSSDTARFGYEPASPPRHEWRVD
ncbi:hypothetical protein LX36DRAFT_362961 [Colletotrichum falcatum]|nr:hypothetical protein LX36DRAFT_362961 [Colletotrichum falcatum]